MFRSSKKFLFRWFFIVATLAALSFVLWNTYTFFQKFKEEERLKMEIWAAATKTINEASLSDTELELPLLILSTNTTIPIIQTNSSDSILSMINVNEKIAEDPDKATLFLHKLKAQNAPIVIEFGKNKQYLYYGNSSLFTKLTYYPFALILFFLIFSIMIFSFYRANKIATENKLWTGMAKETAHQIGTPLSSLLGWIEIMKLEQVDPDIVQEIEKDIMRLESIANRFSKIGSRPQLELLDIVEETQKAFLYLKDRSSKQIQFDFFAPEEMIPIPINKELHSWTIENLVKNAIDSMKGKGKLQLMILSEPKQVKILITDNGSGIPKNKFKKIFEPGFTTKKRGWGLGLSLTKRIVEEFQNGYLKILFSEIGKGTTFGIIYKKTAS